MNTDDTSKETLKRNKQMSEGQALIVLLVGMVTIIFGIIGFVDTVIDPINVSSYMEIFVELHEDRTDLAKSVRDYAYNLDVDTSALNTAIRETERAYVLLEQENYTREAIAIFEQQYADLDEVLNSKDFMEILQSKDAYVALASKAATESSQFPQLSELRNMAEHVNFQEAFEGNLTDISEARLDYNRSAFDFNKEYSQGWPERWMRRARRIILPEKEPVGPEFGALYGTPASK